MAVTDAKKLHKPVKVRPNTHNLIQMDAISQNYEIVHQETAYNR